MKPLVGVIASSNSADGTDDYGKALHYKVAAQYVSAIEEWCDVATVILPLSDSSVIVEEMPRYLDGIVLTGSITMIDSRVYRGEQLPSDFILDKKRDAKAIALVKGAHKYGVPLLGICRGFQEICVGFGGALFENLEEQLSGIRHKAITAPRRSDKYLPAHNVSIAPGGVLALILARNGIEPHDQKVNSLHRQGARNAVPPLFAEAWSPDGLVEAVSCGSLRPFLLGVQWHLEWHVDIHPFYRAILEEFGCACLEHLIKRNGGL